MTTPQRPPVFADQSPEDRRRAIEKLDAMLKAIQGQHLADTAEASSTQVRVMNRMLAAKVRLIRSMLAQMRRKDAELQNKEAR